MDIQKKLYKSKSFKLDKNKIRGCCEYIGCLCNSYGNKNKKYTNNICDKCFHGEIWHKWEKIKDKIKLPKLQELPELLVINNEKIDNILDRFKCNICYENNSNCVLVNCGHASFCINCMKNIKECPLCRKKITEKVKYIPL